MYTGIQPKVSLNWYICCFYYLNKSPTSLIMFTIKVLVYTHSILSSSPFCVSSIDMGNLEYEGIASSLVTHLQAQVLKVEIIWFFV